MRVEFRNSIEAMGAEMRKLFEQVMVQRKSKDNDVSGAESGGSGDRASSVVKLK